MFLGLTRQYIPPLATTSELCIIARQKLLAANHTKETKDIIAELYGLKDGQPKKGSVLAATTGIGIDTIYNRERRFLKSHNIILKDTKNKPA